jgi:ParB family chromosome partitioning protein
MAKRNSLGRGFDALIPKDLDQTILEEDQNRVQKLLITDIYPNTEQPRGEFDQTSLNELATSVKQHGVLQPIIVVRQDNGFRIVAGERRWRAAKSANLKQIPAIVRSLEELEQVELALIENIQRVDLSPLDQALSVYRLQQQFNLPLEEIAKKLSKAPSTVSNLTRLLQLPEEAREALRKGQISEGHARSVLALKNRPEEQRQLLRYIIDNNWSVRQAEQFVTKVKSGDTASLMPESKAGDERLSKALKQRFRVSVKIKRLARGGELIFPFKTSEELQKIVHELSQDSE